jgi:hypothetical protein
MALIAGTKVGSRETRPGGSAGLCGDPAVSTPARLPGTKEDGGEPYRQRRDRDGGHDGQLPRGKD